ncbi:glycoside hydrolase family 15 protein [Echinicola strongylocentroti]|uniref:Glycoside hydrolase family 15 protein n=1 Tax=Echinicola strongylocentroti TaxID=1795355 RepID=A0A2Z4IK16_9BACT|nr:glycoside hydrolase family 15 protein [Echinicola strongylocentroti]AWW31482.1 glycoside hydrolase family 15 protein [Echinicola strongylocentroti]
MTKRHLYGTGLIGNCAYIAHIEKNTNISWLCFPRFDSDFIFGGMLDREKGGEFSILPEDNAFSTQQEYLENTNILKTTVKLDNGEEAYSVTDFAPRFMNFERYHKPLMVVRKIEPISGEPKIKINCKPVTNRGKKKLRPSMNSNHIEFLGAEQEVRLTANCSVNYIMEDRAFRLQRPIYLFFTYGQPLEAPVESTAERFLQATTQYWREWIKSTSIPHFYQKLVVRSALALKIHQFEDTGAIIAASTTSLPESPGSTRNWDYRYCWIRDSYYTLNVFNSLGHFQELERYFEYIQNLPTNANGRYQPLYSITGSALLEEELSDLSGYLDNQPVRFGNQAYTHIQNDLYGQVLVSLLPLYADKRFIESEKSHSAPFIHNLLDKIEETMNEKDAGLWEFRNLAQEHCYTFIFHWAGSCAAIKIADRLEDSSMKEKAERLRLQAIEKIEACYVPEMKAYAQAIGTKNMDASTLQLITMGYFGNDTERANNHLKMLEKDLLAKDYLFYRYKHMDDFGVPETTFLICAFWYIEALACVNRLDEAVEGFETLTKYCNHLQLFSEDVDHKTGSQWGNFPQAYSHVGLMNAAYRIGQKLDKPNFL